MGLRCRTKSPDKFNAFWFKVRRQQLGRGCLIARAGAPCDTDIAAALAANSGKRPRELAVSAIQRELLRQGAYLSPAIATAVQSPRSIAAAE